MHEGLTDNVNSSNLWFKRLAEEASGTPEYYKFSLSLGFASVKVLSLKLIFMFVTQS